MKRLPLVLLLVATAARADKVAGPREMEAPMPEPTPPNAGAVAPVMRPPPRPPRPPAAPKPAPEIAALGKKLAGTYACKGTISRGDGSSRALRATVTIKLALDNAWIQTDMVEAKVPDPSTAAVSFSEYATYDPVAKQWTRIQLASTTGHVQSTTLGEKDGTWTWEGTATSPAGTTQLRDMEQLSGKTLKLWGEALLGGTWQKTYEVSCTH